MVTPSAVNSDFCRFEFDSFIEREKQLGRTDLVFPILYVSVPELDAKPAITDPVISILKDRQREDWRSIRHRDVNSTEVKQTVEQFCSTISKKLRLPWELERQQKEKTDKWFRSLRSPDSLQSTVVTCPKCGRTGTAIWADNIVMNVSDGFRNSLFDADIYCVNCGVEAITGPNSK
jgi:hypothetical protein